MTYMCPDGPYAAFNVNKMHTSKHYILFPSNNTQATHYSKTVTSQNPYKTTILFSFKYIRIFRQPNGKVTLVYGH